jgi:hypothetical protein
MDIGEALRRGHGDSAQKPLTVKHRREGLPVDGYWPIEERRRARTRRIVARCSR